MCSLVNILKAFLNFNFLRLVLILQMEVELMSTGLLIYRIESLKY